MLYSDNYMLDLYTNSKGYPIIDLYDSKTGKQLATIQCADTDQQISLVYDYMEVKK